MDARSRWSITGSVLAVVVGLAIQSQPARAAHSAQYDEMTNYLSVKEQAPICIDPHVSAAERIAACTTIIGLADYGSYVARKQIGTIYVARATAYQEQGNDQAALRDFDAATMREPGSELVWLGLGNYYLEKSEYARALEEFDHAVQVGGKDRVVYVDRGVALTALKRYDRGNLAWVAFANTRQWTPACKGAGPWAERRMLAHEDCARVRLWMRSQKVRDYQAQLPGPKDHHEVIGTWELLQLGACDLRMCVFGTSRRHVLIGSPLEDQG